MEVEEFVAGSFLEDAPMIAVSAITGAGIAELRNALSTAASNASIKDASNFFRLPIDRSFSMRGHGSVVTGTLIAGTLKTEDEVEIFPVDKRARVRGLQIHGARVESRLGGRTNGGESRRRRYVRNSPRHGARAARIVSHHHVYRHDFRTAARRAPSETSRPGSLPRGNGGGGSRSALARIARADEAGFARARALSSWEPLLILPGDRFIVRMFSPVVTIGGGVVLDAAPPQRKRRAILNQRLDQIEKDGLAHRRGERIDLWIDRRRVDRPLRRPIHGIVVSKCGEINVI